MTSTTESREWTEGRWRHEWTEWARSGMLWLSGHPGDPPLWPAAGLMEGLHDTGRRISVASALGGHRIAPEPRQLLVGRAALMGLTRRGRTSPGGACRLLATADGWVAVSLSRPDDADLVPAITGTEPGGDPWSVLAREARSRRGRDVADRAQLVGVPATVLGPLASPTGAGDPERARRPDGAKAGRSAGRPLVVDLSALWAGPLCGKLLGDAGARVVKVESRNRPDGARAGSTDFFDWLHSGHESVVLDFDEREDIEGLHALIAGADVVIEASRPAPWPHSASTRSGSWAAPPARSGSASPATVATALRPIMWRLGTTPA